MSRSGVNGRPQLGNRTAYGAGGRNACEEELSMRKLVAATAAVLLCASVAAASPLEPKFVLTNARIDALGLQNWHVEDDFNIWINPAQISRYKNAIYGEFGVDTCTACGDGATSTGIDDRAVGPFGGLHGEMFGGTVGLWLGRPYSGLLADPDFAGINAASLGAGDGGLPAGALPTGNRFDVFYAPSETLGIMVGYASQSEEGEDGDLDFNEYTLGVGANLMNGALEVAGTVALADAEHNDTTTAAADTDGKEDAMGVTLLARSHRNVGENNRLLTTGRIAWADYDESDLSVLDVIVDAALNCTMHKGALMVLALGAHYRDASNDIEATTIELPVHIAVEHQTFERVQTRFGVSKAIYRNVDVKSDAGDIETTEDGAATVSFGLGWAVQDNLTVDAVVNQDVLFTGTYVVSGIPESLSAKVSAAWAW
jgi:opacity protein-like surface antigen